MESLLLVAVNNTVVRLYENKHNLQLVVDSNRQMSEVKRLSDATV